MNKALEYEIDQLDNEITNINRNFEYYNKYSYRGKNPIDVLKELIKKKNELETKRSK